MKPETWMQQVLKNVKAAALYSVKHKHAASIITGVVSPASTALLEERIRTQKVHGLGDSQQGCHSGKLALKSGQFPLQPDLRLHGGGGGGMRQKIRGPLNFPATSVAPAASRPPV